MLYNYLHFVYSIVWSMYLHNIVLKINYILFIKILNKLKQSRQLVRVRYYLMGKTQPHIK